MVPWVATTVTSKTHQYLPYFIGHYVNCRGVRYGDRERGLNTGGGGTDNVGDNGEGGPGGTASGSDGVGGEAGARGWKGEKNLGTGGRVCVTLPGSLRMGRCR